MMKIRRILIFVFGSGFFFLYLDEGICVQVTAYNELRYGLHNQKY